MATFKNTGKIIHDIAEKMTGKTIPMDRFSDEGEALEYIYNNMQSNKSAQYINIVDEYIDFETIDIDEYIEKHEYVSEISANFFPILHIISNEICEEYVKLIRTTDLVRLRFNIPKWHRNSSKGNIKTKFGLVEGPHCSCESSPNSTNIVEEINQLNRVTRVVTSKDLEKIGQVYRIHIKLDLYDFVLSRIDTEFDEDDNLTLSSDIFKRTSYQSLLNRKNYTNTKRRREGVTALQWLDFSISNPVDVYKTYYTISTPKGIVAGHTLFPSFWIKGARNFDHTSKNCWLWETPEDLFDTYGYSDGLKKNNILYLTKENNTLYNVFRAATAYNDDDSRSGHWFKANAGRRMERSRQGERICFSFGILKHDYKNVLTKTTKTYINSSEEITYVYELQERKWDKIFYLSPYIYCNKWSEKVIFNDEHTEVTGSSLWVRHYLNKR